jgi:hypothetical protein
VVFENGVLSGWMMSMIDRVFVNKFKETTETGLIWKIFFVTILLTGVAICIGKI